MRRRALRARKRGGGAGKAPEVKGSCQWARCISLPGESVRGRARGADALDAMYSVSIYR